MGLFSRFWFGERRYHRPLRGSRVDRHTAGRNPRHHPTHGTITGDHGKPVDVTAMARFLCSPAVRDITGQASHANGGAYPGA